MTGILSLPFYYYLIIVVIEVYRTSTAFTAQAGEIHSSIRQLPCSQLIGSRNILVVGVEEHCYECYIISYSFRLGKTQVIFKQIIKIHFEIEPEWLVSLNNTTNTNN